MKKAVMISIFENKISYPQFFNSVEEAKEKIIKNAMKDTQKNKKDLKIHFEKRVDEKHNIEIYSAQYSVSPLVQPLEYKIFWMDIN